MGVLMFHKNLILFFSYTGNCRRVGLLLSRECGGDVVSVKSRGFGFFKPFVHKRLAKKGKRIVLLPEGFDLAKYDNVFIGGPVWCGFPAPALVDLVSQLDLKGKRVLLFLVAASDFGIAADKLKDLVKGRGASIKGLMTFLSSDSNNMVVEKAKNHLLVLE